MEINLSKIEDDLYLKNIINEWQKNLSSNNQSIILDSLVSIYKVILHVKKDETLFRKFKNQFLSISKIVYNQIYTSVTLIRLYVVKIANLMDYKDLISDVMNYLKMENDIECLKEYLEFIKKYGYIGYIDEILGILDKEKPFIVNLKGLEVILYLSLNYRNNSKYINKAFEFLLNYYENKIPKWEHFFINFFESFLDILKYIEQNKEKLNNVFVFEFCNYFIYKVLNFIDLFIKDLNDENKIQIMNLILLDLAFCLRIIKNLLENNSNLQNYVNDKIEQERYFSKVNFSEIVYNIYFNLDAFNNQNLKYYFLTNFVNNKDIFRDYLIFVKGENNILNFTTKLIKDFIDTQNDRLKNIVLDFIYEFDLILSDSDLQDLVRNLFIYNDNIILKILDIIGKNNFKVVYDSLLKLINSRNMEIVDKVKDILKRDIKE
jgi:hypothetical protein